MTFIFPVLLALSFSSVAAADLPSTAQACNTPAAQHNKHCMPATNLPTVSVPEPSTLGVLSAGLVALYLSRRRKL